MDLQRELFQALKVGGGLHFLTTFLLDRWRKNNNLSTLTVGTESGLLQYPTSTTDKGDNFTPPGQQAGLAYTLYSLDSSLGADVALSVAAALLSPSSGAAGTSMPSTPALAGGSFAPALAAGLAGFVVGQNLA
jgi:hypothetical protein